MTSQTQRAVERSILTVADYLENHDHGVDEETATQDLLADLMHLADSRGWSFESLLDRARDHHDEEDAGGAVGAR